MSDHEDGVFKRVHNKLNGYLLSELILFRGKKSKVDDLRCVCSSQPYYLNVEWWDGTINMNGRPNQL